MASRWSQTRLAWHVDDLVGEGHGSSSLAGCAAHQVEDAQVCQSFKGRCMLWVLGQGCNQGLICTANIADQFHLTPTSTLAGDPVVPVSLLARWSWCSGLDPKP